MNQPSDNNRADIIKIAQGGGIILSGTLIGKIILFLYTLFLAKVLGVNDLGLYFLGLSFIRIISSFSVLGLDTGVVRFVSIYNSRKDIHRLKGTIVISLILSFFFNIFIASVIIVLADFIASNFFNKPDLVLVIRFFALSLPFDCSIKILLASTRGMKLMHYTALSENIVWVSLRFLFALIFIYVLPSKLFGVVLSYLLSSILTALLSLYSVNKIIPFKNSSTHYMFDIRNIFKFSLPMAFSGFLNNSFKQVDIIILGIFVANSLIGAYSTAVRLINIALIFFNATRPIFNPYIAEFCDKRKNNELSKILKTITKLNFFVGFPIFLVLFIFPEFFLSLFGGDFLVAGNCLSILVAANIVLSISSLPDSILFMSGHPGITLKNNIIFLILNIILNYFLIQKYSILGAAISTSVSLVLISATRLIEVYYLTKIHPFKFSLLKPIFAGFLSFVTMLLLFENLFIEKSFINYSFKIAIFFFIYFVLSFAFKFDSDDLQIKDTLIEKLRSTKN
jgi:O-antigen/teichoic acid export membrane protein